MAEGLFRQMVEEESGEWHIASAGIATGGGQPPSDHTLKVLEAVGVDLAGNASQPVSAELVAGATHIFTMSAGHLYAIETVFPRRPKKRFWSRNSVRMTASAVTTSPIPSAAVDPPITTRETYSKSRSPASSSSSNRPHPPTKTKRCPISNPSPSPPTTPASN